eukprot:699044-Karenia_brevis.AAC.1
MKSFCKKMSDVGLSMHEVEITNKSAESLGVQLDLEHRCTRLTERRYWRLRKGLQFVLKMRKLD